MTWDVWSWGVTARAAEEQDLAAQQMEEGSRQLGDAIELEVTQAFVDAGTAREQIAVADAGLAQASESARVARDRHARGFATTTELLDAESALHSARTLAATARIDARSAQARLDRAIGAGR
jgi:outer membrane protein TolC